LIEEKYIQEYLDTLSDDESSESKLERELLLYLDSDMFNVMNPEEKEIMFFCFDVIQQAYWTKLNQLPEFDFDAFNEHEELNWTTREDSKSWDDAKDQFFNNYPEEDLLAFVEDILVDDEDDKLSLIGKEFIFITCKSYIDCFF